MNKAVLCLRPEADFRRVDALPPDSLQVTYRAVDDPDVPVLMQQVRALVISAVGPKLTREFFDGSSVKFVQVTGAGLDRLDVPFLQQRGISVANVPGGSNAAVAEYAVTAASVLLRRFAWADREIRAGHYREFRACMLADNLPGLESLVVGIVGFGAIGVAVAEAFQQRGCSVVYYDPSPRDVNAATRLSARRVTIVDELLSTADIVTLHVPLLPATTRLIGARELALIKPGSVLIQGSRGGIVDETALAQYLASGKLAGAAVDVYSDEPPSPDHPLFELRGEAAERLLFTPHIAGVTRQSQTFLCRKAWENVHRVLVENAAPLYGAV